MHFGMDTFKNDYTKAQLGFKCLHLLTMYVFTFKQPSNETNTPKCGTTK